MSARARIRALVGEHGLVLKKALGQHFLVEDHILREIAEAAMAGGARSVVEVGPGPGTLTLELADRAEEVVAVERDRALLPLLEETLGDRPNVRVIHADALAVEFASLTTGRRPAVAGNIPYNITAPLILAAIAQRETIGDVTFMIQREVATRLLAPPGGKDYGSMSVLLALHADLERVRNVAPGSFFPPPKVSSSVIRIRWLGRPRAEVADVAHFERVVRAAFSQRRKVLQNALQTSFSADRVARAEVTSGVSLRRRAETLDVQEFARLANALVEL